MPRPDFQRLRWPVFLITAPLVVLADQVTKSWIRLYSEGTVIFKEGFFRIVHITNSGAAFGSFQGFSDVLMVIDFAALALILAYIAGLYRKFQVFTNWMGWLGLSLIFGGTTGNLIDRLNPAVGRITDFIYIGPWPAFNVADSAITVGVIVLVYALLFARPGPATKDA